MKWKTSIGFLLFATMVAFVIFVLFSTSGYDWTDVYKRPLAQTESGTGSRSILTSDEPEIMSRILETIYTHHPIFDKAAPSRSVTSPDHRRKLHGLWWSGKSLQTNRKKFGLCLGGGGVQAVMYATGFLRGLNSARVLDEDYMCGISAAYGVSWCLVPVSYVPAFKTVNSVSNFVGEYKDPSQYTINEMNHIQNFPYIGKLFENTTILKNLNAAADALLNSFDNIPVDEVMSELHAHWVLNPLKMYYKFAPVQQDREQVNEVHRQIVEGFSEYNNAFYLRPHFPLPLILITCVDSINWKEFQFFPLEMTPNRVGCLCDNIEWNNIPLGGQISNYCFGGDETQGSVPRVSDVPAAVSTFIDNKYNIVGLNKYIGWCSGVGEVYKLRNPNLRKLVPRVRANFPNSFDDVLSVDHIADGGFYDNSSACVFLARKTEHLIVCLFGGELEPDLSDPKKGRYPTAIQHLFGVEAGQKPHAALGFLEDDKHHSNFWEVVTVMMEKRARGDVGIFTKNYRTRTVEEAGIEPYDVTITWVYPHMFNEYTYRYPLDIQKQLDQPFKIEYMFKPALHESNVIPNFWLNSYANVAAHIAHNYIAPILKNQI